MLYRNEEIVLQNKLIIEHSYIEKGLKFIERETVIPSSRKRCDILFEDKTGRKLYIEVKEVVDDKAIEQIIEYRRLVKNKNSRFMLIANHPINDIYKSKLQEIQIEYMVINKNLIKVYMDNIVEIPKGDSKFRNKENVIKKFNKQATIVYDIYDYVANQLHTPNRPILCNISDGIMFQLIQCKVKFLSLSTIGNRLLFHFPIGNRDYIYFTYKTIIPECIHTKTSI